MTTLDRLLKIIALIEIEKQFTADWLAEKIGASPRTIYRDIVALRRNGWRIPGEAGVGYINYGKCAAAPNGGQ